MQNFQGTDAFQLQWVIRSIVFNSILAKLQQTNQDFKTHTHTHTNTNSSYSPISCVTVTKLPLAKNCHWPGYATEPAQSVYRIAGPSLLLVMDCTCKHRLEKVKLFRQTLFTFLCQENEFNATEFAIYSYLDTQLPVRFPSRNRSQLSQGMGKTRH